MANGFMTRSAENPICPICGYPGNDYCGRRMTSEGLVMIVCMRTHKCVSEGLNYFDAEGNCMGKDGNFYLRVGTSKSGNGCFMEANAKMAYDVAHGIQKKPKNFKMPEYVAPKPKVVVDEVQPLPPERLHRVYSLMAKHLKLEDWHREYLHRDGWTDEMIEKYQIVSFPEKDFSRFKYRKDVRMKCPYRKKLASLILEDLGNPPEGLRGVPGAYQDKNGNWTFSGPSGIIHWQPDINGNLYGARIRMDWRDQNTEILQENGKEYFIENGQKWYLSMKGACRILPDGSKEWKKDGNFKGKYRNLSSYVEDEEELKNNRIVNIYTNGCQSGNKLGYYIDRQRDDMFICFITEGEKKGAFANYKMKAPFVTLPGVSSWSLLFKGDKGSRPIDQLKAMGIQYLVIAFDADKTVNADVLAKEQQTVAAVKEEGMFIGAAEWDINLGKGLDDLLAAGYKPTYTVC